MKGATIMEKQLAMNMLSINSKDNITDDLEAVDATIRPKDSHSNHMCQSFFMSYKGEVPSDVYFNPALVKIFTYFLRSEMRTLTCFKLIHIIYFL